MGFEFYAVICSSCAVSFSLSTFYRQISILTTTYCGLLVTLFSACLSATSGAFSISNLTYIVFILTNTISSMPLLLNVVSRGFSKALYIFSFMLTILVTGLLLLSAQSLFSVIVAFELMLFGALGLLKTTGKTERATESLYEMFSWAIVGSFFLLCSLALNAFGQPFMFSTSSPYNSLAHISAIVGFSIKVPLWPFASWLLKAHVEASTEFSIFLSGFLVKFGVIGLIKLSSLYCMPSYCGTLVLCLAYIGFIDAVFKLISQVDLKRMVACLTILETNWLIICLFSGNSYLVLVGLCLIFAHCLTTTMEFYSVECVYRRFSSRSILDIFGLAASLPNLGKLLWAVVLTTIGLPGTVIFALKLVFLTCLARLNLIILLMMSVVFLLVLPVFIVRVWSSILGGQLISRVGLFDVTLTESILILFCFCLSVIFGFAPLLFFL
jgi:NADH-quinone oxidoreductase subunit M